MHAFQATLILHVLSSTHYLIQFRNAEDLISLKISKYYSRILSSERCEILSSEPSEKHRASSLLLDLQSYPSYSR
ncbi:hypothetical protein LINPERHAP1_LOCUS6187 [Linum perenne]